MSILEKYLVLPKLLYFILSLHIYTLHSYRGLFAKKMFGIDEGLYGKVNGILMLIAFFSNIAIGNLIDWFHQPVIISILMLIGSTICFLLFFIVKSILQFWMCFFVYVLFCSGLVPIIDRIILEFLSQHNYSSEVYGKQRMFGTLGYVVACYSVEKLVGGNDILEFSNLRIYLIGVTVLAVSISFCFYKRKTPFIEVKKKERKNTGIIDLLKTKSYMFFIGIIFFIGLGRSVMTLYLTTYLSKVLKIRGFECKNSWWFWKFINENPMATLAFFGVSVEVLILFFLKYISKIGLYWPLLIAGIAQMIRFIGYYFLKNGKMAFLWCCGIESMKGINFGLTHSSGVRLANSLCPEHLKSTSQMIYSGSFGGLASVIAGWVFGNMFDEINADTPERITEFKTIFLINAFLCVVFSFLFIFKYGIIDKKLKLWCFQKKYIDIEEEKI
ncbi:MFS_1-like transporter [Hamiltosporidium tvaerminnensis]|uniref:MFS_1-like transporter n=2 Tax=Hamiltosporidium TaxID=1176354 RepID=A0A4Q9LLN2_9MICR|nr:hypothetical protein LUQ84_3433 [Hamiltosporidium tvaerminnensis]TBU03785.1 MFS_1-like transporter [Hamiltosporidium tvaerminnensis]TBU04894.1 MFS_1-like transporter [Hamiltosporidium magnivora]TBU08856.1 MFS_1-like transporter [Hamiltosporidium magnivora]TBU20867.1 MFS_1-like transporter [Hamiltosporidium tvaerminnensis]